MTHLGHLFGNSMSNHLASHRYEMTNYARALVEFGRTTTADEFLEAMAFADEMYATLGPVLEMYNVLICPTTALPAVPADHDSTRQPVVIDGVEVDPIIGWEMTYPFNIMSRCPVLSVPTGIQIVGRTYDDISVFRAAAALSSAPAPGWTCPSAGPVSSPAPMITEKTIDCMIVGDGSLDVANGARKKPLRDAFVEAG